MAIKQIDGDRKGRKSEMLAPGLHRDKPKERGDRKVQNEGRIEKNKLEQDRVAQSRGDCILVKQNKKRQDRIALNRIELN